MKTFGLILALLAGAAFAGEHEGHHEKARHEEKAHHDDGLSAESLYQYEAKLQDQTGAKVSFDVYKGSPVLVTMFYSSCTYACPIIISSIRRVEQQLSPEARGKLRVLLVSMDPERDTPEAMAKLMKAHGADPERWRMVRPSKEGAEEIAALLQMTYRKNADGTFAHSAEITLLDGEGVKAYKLEAPGDDKDELIQKIEALAKAAPAGTN